MKFQMNSGALEVALSKESFVKVKISEFDSRIERGSKEITDTIERIEGMGRE